MDRLLVGTLITAIVAAFLAGPYLIYAACDMLMSKGIRRHRHRDTKEQTHGTRR